MIARVLWNRGLNSAQLLDRFLRPDLSQLPDPCSIIDMGRAADRAAEAVLNGEKIAVYGDYDVDGTCGSSLLVDFFGSLGVEVIGYQPNRFTEGYGVHVAAVEKLIDEGGARVVITVDCGITAVEPARVARERGADMIILDHHKLGAELPGALAVVNPQRPEDESGLQNLCGAGLAFFFAVALRARLREAGYFAEGRQEPNVARLLDLVAIATVADVVDIRGVNRILVAHGLKLMARGPRLGIRALLEAAGVARPTSMTCGFVLGPRINAAGRLKSARAAFDLLTSADAATAKQYAQELEELNRARRATQDTVLAAAREQALAQLADPLWERLSGEIPAAGMGPWPRALVLAAPEGAEGWHEGVVGIVASKIVEEFGRPAFILAQKEGADGVLKGSVRSVPKIDILAAISADSVAAHLLNFGGHAHAGGVSLERAKLAEFTTALNFHMALTTSEEQFRRERRSDAELDADSIDPRLVEELERLEPFGHKFPEPVFRLEHVEAADVRVMKEKHLKIRVAGARGPLDAVWFNAPGVGELAAGREFSLWVSPQWNEWNGTRRLQLQVRHGEIKARGE
jgi:single-stranded-DNA-specific exonuclease